MWKYELEYRIDKPGTVGETDKHFDLDNYKDWLEEQLTNCRKQLSIHIVSNCKHENEQMHQGDGFVYVTRKDCGTDL
jgi:hypothetical protein